MSVDQPVSPELRGEDPADTQSYRPPIEGPGATIGPYKLCTVDLLRQAIAKGYASLPSMKQDKDLDPIRQREDFKKLIAELESKRKPAGK
jgi:hypothetical protein